MLPAGIVMKQSILVLYLAGSSPLDHVVGWSLYDPSNSETFDPSGDKEPPYSTAFEAMKDGWRIIKFPSLKEFSEDQIHETKYLDYEFILEKLV